MKAVVLLSIISLFLNSDLPKKHSNLIEWGMNGKIKSIKLYHFNDVTIEKDSILVDTIDWDSWDRFAHTYYNLDGMTDSMHIFNHQNKDPFTIITDYQSDTTNTYLVLKGDTSLLYKTIWTSKYSYQIDIMNEGELEKRNIYTLNKDFHISEILHQVFEPTDNSVSFEFKEQVFFNKQHQIDSIVTITDNVESEVMMNKDLELDEQGNPIKSLKTFKHKSPQLIIREFEYY